MKRLSIRWRLTVWIGMTVSAVLLLTGAAMVLSARHLLLTRAHNALSEELREISVELEIDGDEAAFCRAAEARFFYHNIYEFAIFSTDGRPVFRSAGLQSVRPEELQAQAFDQQIRLRKCVLGDGREMLVSGWVRSSSFGPLLVTAATSTEPFNRELVTLESTVAMILPVSLACSLICGYWLAGRVLRPVRELARAARALSIDSLDQRIHVENPHDEIGRLAETLNLLLARLETAVHEIRRFTADASHEIRTPLAALRAEADLALLRVRTPQEYQQALQIIVDEATRLGRLADQLLDLSRSDAGAVNRALRPVSLTAILQDTVEHLQVLAEQRGLQLKLLSGPCGDVPGDEFRLGMVCSNLIENAIKYSRPGGKIRVSCRPEGQQTVLEVSDDGIGISAEHLPRVFDRFFRADGSRSSAGAGLGLSIAQSIIRAHHGDITIASEPGKGTVVSVRLPSVEGSVVRDSNRRSVEPLLEEVSVQA